MSNENLNSNGMNLSDIKRQAMEQEAQRQQEENNEAVNNSNSSPNEQENESSAENSSVNSKPVDEKGSSVVLPKDDSFIMAVDTKKGFHVVPADQAQPPESPSGSGLIIENNREENAQQGALAIALPHGVMPETAESIANYMREMDKQIEEERQKALAAGYNEEAAARGEKQTPKRSDDETDEEEEFDQEKYDKAIVIIDKSGMGQVINFTDEEREKLKKVRSITLKEVEVQQLETLKIRKAKKNSVDKILNYTSHVHTTPIVLTASGYTAVMKGLSTYELISLMSSSQNALIDARTRWSLLHSKIVDSSIGKMDFDAFLKNTAAVDYNTLIYGVLVATYPDDDKYPLQCPKCDKNFEHPYSPRSLIRAEKMSDRLMELVKTIVDGSHTAQSAKEVHESSPLNTVKRILLPVSGFYVDLHVQSAYDLINNSIEALTRNNEEKYNQAAVLGTAVKQFITPDPENPGEWLGYEDALDITKLIYNLRDTDILTLTKQTEIIMGDLSFDFGLMDVSCPHCAHHEKTIPIDIESVLFYRYRQAMNTEIE